MVSGGGGHQGGRGRIDRFRDALNELKRTGSAFLIVGDVPTTAHADTCATLLGPSDGVTRHRIIVRTGDRLTADPTDGPHEGEFDARIVDAVARTRSATEAAPDVDATEPDEPTFPDSTALGLRILDAIDAVEEEAAPLEPSALRVCLDSIAPLACQYDEEELFRFLALLNGRIRSADGFGHAHLPVDRHDSLVGLFGPLFDGVVELRVVDGTVQQRWHVREADARSGWFVLE